MLEAVDNFKHYSYPGIVASVTSRYQGEQNIMSAGWHTLISYQPGIYGVSIRKETYSYELIERSRAFGINFLPAQHSNWIQAAGTFTGSKINKFKEYGITFTDGLKLNVPILTQAYGAYECKVIDIHTYGTHQFIVGEIVQNHCDLEKFKEDMLPDLSKLSIPLYLGRSGYLTVDDTLKTTTHPFYLEK